MPCQFLQAFPKYVSIDSCCAICCMLYGVKAQDSGEGANPFYSIVKVAVTTVTLAGLTSTMVLTREPKVAAEKVNWM